MLKYLLTIQLLVAFILCGALSMNAASVSFEAESGTAGSDFTNGVDGDVQFISISTDFINSNNPGNGNRVTTYTVTFPAAGTYQLYARVRVGPDPFNDDSLFYAGSFGTKSPTANSDWVLVNGLGEAGFDNSADIVTGGGTLGGGVWKWINLSQFTGNAGFTVEAGDLTQIFQIGARENGLDLDKFVFGTAGYIFTVSDLDNADGGTPPPQPSVTIDPARTFQTIEGLGGAICFYNGWITAHPYKLEIYTNAFAGLNLSMLRLGDWFRYQGTPNFDPDAPGFVSNADRILGHPVPILMSSWSPPAFLKSNGQVGNGGTLLYTNGGFAYTNFANYWYDSLLAYRSNGISPTWISIQNEPDWAASYDSCVFHPAEDTVNGTNYASYSKALDAVYHRLINLPSPPKLLGPEVVGLGYNAVQNYATTMNANDFYGVAHHLYGGSTDGTPDGYISAMRALTNVFPDKPRFMTEYGVSNMIEQANLIHNVLTVEQASGYNYWSLIWPGASGGLIQIENPWNRSSWTNAPPGTSTQSHGWWIAPAYWAMKHYSYFIRPGFKRIAATSSDANILASAYISPDGLRLVAVFINRNTSPSDMDVNFGSFSYSNSRVYQTAGDNHFQLLGPVGSQLNLPASSLTTVVLDKSVIVGPPNQPSPANNESGVASDTTLSWIPGSNALLHAAYFGADSNAVAQATINSPEFLGILTNNYFSPALFGNSTYYWRVDEIAGVNTNTGMVWSFHTEKTPELIHRYRFSETSGTTVADSVGGSEWNGTLPNGGTFSNGQLLLSSNLQQYVNLPAGIISYLNAVTIEAWATFPTNLPWATWFFGFGDITGSSGGNYLFCSPGGGRFAVTGVSPGYQGETNAYTSRPTWSGKTLHVTCVFDPPDGYIAIYTNGVLADLNPSGTYTMGSIIDRYSFINRSLYSGDPYIDLTLNEFRIYGAPLSAEEIAATEALGPDEVLSDDNPNLNFSVTSSNMMLTWPLADAGFALQSRTNLATGNWTNVAAPKPQIASNHWQIVLPAINDASSTFYRLVK